MAQAYQAVGYLCEFVKDSPDMVRLLDILAYEKTMDGIELLPFPREQFVLIKTEKAPKHDDEDLESAHCIKYHQARELD